MYILQNKYNQRCKFINMYINHVRMTPAFVHIFKENRAKNQQQTKQRAQMM